MKHSYGIRLMIWGTIHRMMRILVVSFFMTLMLLISSESISAAQLTGAADYVTDNTPNSANVVHNIGFVVPTGGHNIQLSDYIILTFTNYTSLTLPTTSSGWTGGSPIYSVVGNKVFITNVELTATNGAGISGITATNPGLSVSDDVIVEIASDSLGTIVYDAVVISPIIYKSTTTTSVTVATMSASLEFKGFTSPNAFVTIMLNGSVVGTTIANGFGHFSKLIGRLASSMNYNVAIFAQDANQNLSQSVTFVAFTVPHMNIVLSDIVIPTTISLSPPWIYEREDETVTGMAHPYSQISIFFDGSSSYSAVVQANEEGRWKHIFDTAEFPLDAGFINVYAKEVVEGGYTSEFTDVKSFEVRTCRIADLNCDTRVNLTDFSILMYFWQQIIPSNQRADINKDGIVDLTDFSLMLYYWTD